MVAATVMALSPFMIYYSGEGRNYAVMVFLVVISTLSMVIAARGGWRWLWAVYALSSCLALYSHYTAVFVLFGQFLWLVWAHPRARRPALLANVAVLIGFLPWLPGFRADGDSPTTALANQLLPFNSTAVDSVLFWSVGAANNFVLKLDDMPGPLALALIAAALIVALAGIVIRAVSEPGFRRRKWRLSRRHRADRRAHARHTGRRDALQPGRNGHSGIPKPQRFLARPRHVARPPCHFCRRDYEPGGDGPPCRRVWDRGGQVGIDRDGHPQLPGRG